jgi:hypothetical protein
MSNLMVSWNVLLFRSRHFRNLLPADSNSKFSIKEWPTHYPEAQEALRKIDADKSHRIIPVPAYDTKGKVIEPSQYRIALQGALVELYFTLKHYDIVGKKNQQGTNVYVADISSITVLIPPKPKTPPTSPRKRRVPLTDPMGSQSKKRLL